MRYARITLPDDGLLGGMWEDPLFLHLGVGDIDTDGEPELNWLISWCKSFADTFAEIGITWSKDKNGDTTPVFTDDQLYRLIVAAAELSAAVERVVGNARTKPWDGLVPEPSQP
jgi:hypothetical protein